MQFMVKKTTREPRGCGCCDREKIEYFSVEEWVQEVFKKPCLEVRLELLQAMLAVVLQKIMENVSDSDLLERLLGVVDNSQYEIFLEKEV